MRGWLRHWSSPEEWSKQSGIQWRESTCIAELRWLSRRVPSPAAEISVLPCKPHPQDHPQSILSFLPQQLQAWESGAHTWALSPSFPEMKFGGKGRVPFNAAFFHNGKTFWSQSHLKYSGGFHQTPHANMVRLLLTVGTADSALGKVGDHIRSKMNGKKIIIIFQKTEYCLFWSSSAFLPYYLKARNVSVKVEGLIPVQRLLPNFF